MDSVALRSQDDAPLPGEEAPRGDAADEDSRIHTDAEDSDDEVVQNRGDDEELEEDDGEDLLENMEGYAHLCTWPRQIVNQPINKTCKSSWVPHTVFQDVTYTIAKRFIFSDKCLF